MNTNIKFSVCKICLKTSGHLFGIRALGLEDTYTMLSDIPLDLSMFPRVVCTVCAIQLRKARQLARKCKWAHKLLVDVQNKKLVTTIKIDDVERINGDPILGLPKLNKTHFQPNHFDLQINEDILFDCDRIVKLEEEWDHDYDIKKNYNEEMFEEFIEVVNTDERETEIEDEDIKSEDQNENLNEFDEEVNKVNIEKSIVFNVITDKSDVASNLLRVSNRRRPAKAVRENVNRRRRRLTKSKADEKGIANESEIIKRKTSNKKILHGPIIKENFKIRKLNSEELMFKQEELKLSSLYLKSPYKCDTCYRGFTVEAHYAAHMEKHSESFGEFECTLCRLRFRSLPRRNSHLLKHKTLYACKQCSYKTMSKVSAINHLTRHRGTVHKCEICPNVAFDFRSSLLRHKRRYHPTQNICLLCGRGCLDERGLTKHLEWKHPGQSNQILEGGSHCDKCKVTFASDRALATHQISQHGGFDSVLLYTRNRMKARTTDKYKCNECPQVFSLRARFINHLQEAHGLAAPAKKARGVTAPAKKALKRVYRKQCHICGKLFVCEATLRDHAGEHSERASHGCEQCGKSFKTRAKLLMHQRGHTKKYSCPVCLKSYVSSSNRDRHYKNVHNRKRDLKCHFCPKCFKCNQERRAHEMYVHMKKPWPKRNRKRNVLRGAGIEERY